LKSKSKQLGAVVPENVQIFDESYFMESVTLGVQFRITKPFDDVIFLTWKLTAFLPRIMKS
jgi:hypothetical protein